MIALSPETRGFVAIGLVSPKDPKNAGSVLRAATCFRADVVIIEGARGYGSVARAVTDTTRAFRHIPTILTDDLFAAHPIGSVPVAVDLIEDAQSLFDFVHPQTAFYIFGPEDGALGRHHFDRCRHRVSIPTAQCMNLAATVNVVLYDRAFKTAAKRVLS